jgi:hypothetical protein
MQMHCFLPVLVGLAVYTAAADAAPIVHQPCTIAFDTTSDFSIACRSATSCSKIHIDTRVISMAVLDEKLVLIKECISKISTVEGDFLMVGGGDTTPAESMPLLERVNVSWLDFPCTMEPRWTCVRMRFDLVVYCALPSNKEPTHPHLSNTQFQQTHTTTTHSLYS